MINLNIWIFSVQFSSVLEKEMATPSSTLAWRIPWREEPGRLHTNWNYIPPLYPTALIFYLQIVVLFVNFFFFPVVGVPSGWQSLSDCQRTRWITFMSWMSFPLCFRSVCSTAVSLNERATSACSGNGQGWCLTLGFFLSVLFSPPLPPSTLTRLFAFCSFTHASIRFTPGQPQSSLLLFKWEDGGGRSMHGVSPPPHSIKPSERV